MGDDQPLFVLAGNGPYENRGCEAIVRGTVKVLREQFKDPKFLCLSFFTAGERQFLKQINSEFDGSITHINSNLVTKSIAMKYFYRPEVWEYFVIRFLRKESLKYFIYKDILPHIDHSEAVLSIGGDNYSIDYGGLPSLFTDLDDIVSEKRKKIYLWGASIGPFGARPEYEKFMADHLQQVTGIFSRESVTTNYLRSIGVHDNLYTMADPAFVMDAVQPKEFSEPFEMEESIGLNISPLMSRYICNGDLDAWKIKAASIISRIISSTGRSIYLIPHVTTPESNDHSFMQSLITHLDNPGKVTLIPPTYNAAETKWIISRMCLFAGARTHATIAALSSCVPTLSFAYSIKAVGISKDIYGTTDFCVSTDSINTETIDTIVGRMLDQERQIRNHLDQKIPGIKDHAMNAGKTLQQLIQ